MKEKNNAIHGDIFCTDDLDIKILKKKLEMICGNKNCLAKDLKDRQEIAKTYVRKVQLKIQIKVTKWM